MTKQQKVLLAVIALLIPVWWLTLPQDEPRQSMRLPTPQPSSDMPDLLLDPSAPRMPYIDTSRPECVKMRDELLAQQTRGSSGSVVYIGDCDTRYRPEDSQKTE